MKCVCLTCSAWELRALLLVILLVLNDPGREHATVVHISMRRGLLMFKVQ